MDYIKLRDKVASRVKSSRFIHSLGVAETSALLASRFSLDVNDALCCGIYHDAYRYSDGEECIALLEKSGFIIEDEERREPMLLHGALAALYFDEDAGEEVPESLKRAVRWHTLGSPDMGKLGALIYIADYMEPGRKHLSEEERRKILLSSSLEEMTALIIEEQRPYLESTGAGLAGITERLYTFIKDGGVFEE